ncbi:hypothetical protein ACFSHQ_12315 [Gemmobacter lanyuensis]
MADGGDDTILGGAGSDTLQLDLNRAAAAITYAGGVYTLTAADRVLTISDVETFSFADAPAVNGKPVLASLTTAATAVTEGNSGVTEITFTLTLDRPADSTLTVGYTVSDGERPDRRRFRHGRVAGHDRSAARHPDHRRRAANGKPDVAHCRRPSVRE